jgi:ADP-heptose:LPS heptosyltransferase
MPKEPRIITIDPEKDWRQTDLGKPKEEPWFCVTRYGGIGDVLQATAVFPAIKAMGYKLCVNTQVRCLEYLRGNPYIDEFVVHETEQIMNEELGEFWASLAKKYGRYTNFSESVERTLLAVHTEMKYAWPPKARHLIMDVNYQELLFAIATVPFERFEVTPPFYPDKKEKAWAEKERAKMNKRVVMWSLSGSAHHKVSPWTDAAMMQLLIADPDLTIILTGDEACKLLVGGSWVNEPRVIDWTGFDIRKTLTFMDYADVVIGPETGVSNAAGMLPDTHSILLCSHSNPNKVSKHFVNHTDLEPEGLNCYPCHVLHTHSSDNCYKIDLREIMEDPSDEDKPLMTAACTIAIDADQIANAIKEALR